MQVTRGSGDVTRQCPSRAKRTVTHCCTRERTTAQRRHTTTTALLSFFPSFILSFFPSYVRLSPHSTARASTERVESHGTALAQQSLSKHMFVSCFHLFRLACSFVDVRFSVTSLRTECSCRSFLCLTDVWYLLPQPFCGPLHVLCVSRSWPNHRSSRLTHHRVALDWLFDRINLDSKIQIKYIDTKPKSCT